MVTRRFECSHDYWLLLCKLVHEGRSGPDELK
jgi:hypothetical protein